MTCDECRPRVDDLAAGLLAPDEAASVEAHVAACGRCGHALESARRIVSRLRAGGEVDARVAAPRRRPVERILAVALIPLLVATAVYVAMPRPAREVVAQGVTSVRLGKRGRLEASDGAAFTVASEGRIDVRRGRVAFDIVPGGGPFIIGTPLGEVEITGTTLCVEVQEDTRMRKTFIGVAAVSVALISGTCIYRANQEQHAMRAGDAIVAQPGAHVQRTTVEDWAAKLYVPPVDGSAEVADLRRQVAALQKERDQLREEKTALERRLPPLDDARARDEALRRDEERLRVPDAAAIAQLQSIALDASRNSKERADALGQLRRTRDGRTEAVAAAMLQLLEAEPNEHIRAEICRQIKGAVPLGLKDALLRTLANDPAERVREEAAESLGPLRADPSVRAALEHAATNDPSPRVRKEAIGAER